MTRLLHCVRRAS